jgi:hypothetical protein
MQHEDVTKVGDGRFNRVMIGADYLKRIAAWSRELTIVEKSYRANEYIFMRGDRFDYWTGVVTGLAGWASCPVAARPPVLRA